MNKTKKALIKRFKISKKHFKNFYHIDCYRIKNEKDILELGLKEIILDPKNIVAIEWSEKIKKILPKDAILIKFDFIPHLLTKNRSSLNISSLKDGGQVGKNRREVSFKM